ncbi:MAG TPA: hypothetical protein VFQ85_13250 [Mycobacteriales bacterium]|jgi:hypothetical protein|nr:hypothetical protein [Mycobacteriales bacterium]
MSPRPRPGHLPLVAAVLLLAAAPACARRCPAGGCDRRVTVAVTTTSPPDASAVRGCVPAAVRDGATVTSAEPGVVLRVRAAGFGQDVEREVVACLRRVPGVTGVRVARPR